MSTLPKLTLRHLPHFRVPLTAPVLDGGVIEMPAGDFIQVANAESVRFVAHLEFRAGATASRGNHYHLAKTEVLTVIRGRLRARYADIDSGDRLERLPEAGGEGGRGPRWAPL